MPLHRPLQQSAGYVHVVPSWAQLLVPQVPVVWPAGIVHAFVQHSDAAVHCAPSFLQYDAVPHTPEERHVPVQHWEPEVQERPSPLHDPLCEVEPLFELLQAASKASASDSASPVIEGRVRVGMVPDLRR